MGGPSKIEWTERTWNPVVGCSIVSPGCTNCYAMRAAWRFKASYVGRNVAGPAAENVVRKVNGNAVWTGQLAMAPDYAFFAPLHRKKPTTYFVNSMGDLFHEDCPDDWIDQVFAVMALSPQHTFQVLTKRAARMRDYCSRHAGVWLPQNRGLKPLMSNELIVDSGAGREGPLPNVWLGVSTERQQEADERIPLLLQTPAAVRFISAEPLLGKIDLTNLGDATMTLNAFDGVAKHLLGIRDQTAGVLDWVIVGGESGPHARPMHPAWAAKLRDQCDSARVPFFFKQWGEFRPSAAGEDLCVSGVQVVGIDGLVRRVGKKAAGRLLDGVEHNGFPKVPA